MCVGVQIIYTTFGALLIQDDAGSSSLTKLFAQACEDAASVAFHAMGGVFWCRDRYWLCSHGSSAAVALLGDVAAKTLVGLLACTVCRECV